MSVRASASAIWAGGRANVCFVGDQGAGKTSLIRSSRKNKKRSTKKSTIGIDTEYVSKYISESNLGPIHLEVFA